MSAFVRPAAGEDDPEVSGRYRPVTSQFAIAPPVSVVIPAMNEAENLPYVFKTLPDWIHEVVLVDGNSTDDTVRVARDLYPDVKVVEQRGKGKGDALITGFAACTGEIIVMVDADGSADGGEIVSYVSALVGGADFAKGSRFANGGGTDDMTLIRKLGNRVLCSIVNHKFGARYTDLCYGYNAFWKHCLDAIALDCARLRGRDPDEHQSGQGRAAGPGDSQPRIRPDPRREQSAGRARRAARAQGDPARARHPPRPASAAAAGHRTGGESRGSLLSTAPTGRTGAPSVSVVICVYTEDRWGDILAAVASVLDQSYPALETLLVVDHNPALLRRLAKAYGDDGAGAAPVPCGCWPTRARVACRRAATPASRPALGEVIAFLDDDAVAERDWLLHFAEGYADPRVMAVGGRTQPVWASRRRPAWFPEEFDWVVGCTYRGLPPGKTVVRNVLGGNASFRRSALEAVGGFASGIGRDGHRLPLGCEETELCIRLTRAVPEALLLIDDRSVIHHRVPAARERFGYFRDRAYAEGLSKALVTHSVGGPGRAGERAPVHHPRAARGRRARGAGRTAGQAGRRRAGRGHRGGAGGDHRRLRTGGLAGAPGRRAVRGGGRAGEQRGRGGGGMNGPSVAQRPVPILMYHSVARTPARAAYGLSVSPEAFDEQMRLLDGFGFTPVTAEQLAAAWRAGRPLPPRSRY
ncbi:hypothetical protein GCM10020000_63930 [Streptomyces olivoverticillatus]